MHVALLTGARTGEIMALKVSDIDFENNMITFQRSIRRGVISGTKTGDTRLVPMVKSLVNSLKKYINDTNKVWVFQNPYSSTPHANSCSIVNTYYIPLLERLNIEFKLLYNTRHSFTSVAVEHEIPLATVSKCLGHSNISTTERFYLKFGNVDQEGIRSQLENLTI